MKKMILFVVCLITMGMQSVKAQNAKIILHHQGTVSFYYPSQTQNALDAAVDGDTIYFNEGSFAGDITISQKVALIGQGNDKSVISGNVTISIADGESGLTARLLDALYISGTITIDKALKGMVVRKCSFHNISFNADISEAIVDRCYCRYYVTESTYGGILDGFYLTNYVRGLTVINSKIGFISGNASSPENAVFKNCNIRRLNFWTNSKCMATYINCILGVMTMGQSNYDISTTYFNCLVQSDYYKYSEYHDCWSVGQSLFDGSADCVLSDNELQEAGYIGTDGTVVGITGGDTPFTLDTDSPKITDYSSSVDPKTMKVTINLKVANK